LNVLEATRARDDRPLVIYASTNKVYGGMEEIEVVEEDTRFRYRDLPDGIPESATLDFHSPYGCSKGAADQYVRDYFRIYGLPTVVFRQSCIYGPRQFGIEDQGWAAWFMIAALLEKPIVIHGNGKQVRDMLHVDDLIRAYLTAIDAKDDVGGKIFNIGGGPQNTMSIWAEFGPMLESLVGHPIPVAMEEWRQGDQPVYVSDISRAKRELGWRPEIGCRGGLADLYEWVAENRDTVASALSNPSA
jgi:CDP-paratose 2-epimerase